MTIVCGHGQASGERELCAIALFAHTDSLNRELRTRAAHELAAFVLILDQGRCEYGRVHRPRPMTGLRDANGAGTRDALQHFIELGELDPPKNYLLRG